MHVIHQKGLKRDRIGRGWNCVSDGKKPCGILKTAQIEMGFVRKNRQLFFGLERNQKRN